ncbi:hypothetical protein [Virgibacillus pantothenticus]|uniref:hypothetical protein n=1 Tax=Virgibacillus pantothenticus TaxID=1473 RepID=UPI001C211460|nr:hypothetical protein [Virgibacillus pantothenticus]MBU8640931.1 hypothetical protein [Virgibacillus pantothenticus]
MFLFLIVITSCSERSDNSDTSTTQNEQAKVEMQVEDSESSTEMAEVGSEEEQP